MQTRQWEDKQGQKRYTTEVNAKNIQFLGGQAGAGAGSQRVDNTYNQMAPQNESVMNQDYDISTDSSFTADDIPF